MKRLLQCLLGMRLCVQPPRQLPKLQVCLYGADLGSGAWARHWNNSGTIGSSLTSSEEPWSGVQAPQSLVPSPLLLGLGWTPRFGGYCLRTVHFPVAPLFAGGAAFGGWPGVGAGLSPVSHLVTSEAGAWRVRSYTAGLRLMGQRG